MNNAKRQAATVTLSPYPTPEAYEAASGALWHWRAEASRLVLLCEETARRLRYLAQSCDIPDKGSEQALTALARRLEDDGKAREMASSVNRTPSN